MKLTTVVPLVQPPGLVDRDVSLLDDLQDRIEGDLGSGQKGSVSHIEFVIVSLERLTSIFGLLQTLLAEVSIEPSAEPVLLVPLRLSVTDHDNLVSG